MNKTTLNLACDAIMQEYISGSRDSESEWATHYRYGIVHANEFLDPPQIRMWSEGGTLGIVAGTTNYVGNRHRGLGNALELVILNNVKVRIWGATELDCENIKSNFYSALSRLSMLGSTQKTSQNTSLYSFPSIQGTEFVRAPLITDENTSVINGIIFETEIPVTTYGQLENWVTSTLLHSASFNYGHESQYLSGTFNLVSGTIF